MRAAGPLADFVAFCSELTLEDGKPLKLYREQRTYIADALNGTTETLVLLPKKNGKSTLSAALALFHLVVTRDAECVIVAASRDQAAIILRQCRGFIRRNESLQRLMEPRQREINSTQDDGRIRVLASDVDTADGVIPTLAIVDELHRHKSADLYGVMRDGLGPRNGRMLTISTAGDDEDSPLGKMRTAAYALPHFKRDGAYRYAKSANGEYVMHEWALDPDEDRDDLAIVKAANPAPWHTVTALRRRRDSPSMTAWQWARFACGVWLQGEDRVIGPVEWSECGSEDDLRPRDGSVVRMGIDLGWKDDCTAIVPHWFDDDIAYLGVPEVLLPPKDGGLRKDAVLAAIERVRDRFGADVIVIDPENDGEVLAQDLEALGFEVIAHSQKPAPMALAAERFYASVREKTIRHPRDATLSRHVMNAVKKSTVDGSWRFVKETKQSSKHIDALIAAAMVHSVAIGERLNPRVSVYESRSLMTV